MATNMATAATSPALIPAAVQSAGGKELTDEEVRRMVAALEEPFDPPEIKWRVTNITKDRARGQVMAYADQRAYTDRLNAIFTVRGWTRKYRVEMINNVERKTSHVQLLRMPNVKGSRPGAGGPGWIQPLAQPPDGGCESGHSGEG